MLPKFNKWCWVALLISSIPIHVLFNSILFEIGYRDDNGKGHSLTIATEEFIHGGPYFPPGASLLSSGQRFVGLGAGSNTGHEIAINTAYGNHFGIDDYDDPGSPMIQNISKIARHAGNWTKLDPRTCWRNYINCGDLIKYRDLVVVIDKPAGWIRKDMWQLSTSQDRFWDRYIPAYESNHLFFHAQCPMESLKPGPAGCFNHCRSALAVISTDSKNLTQVSQNGRYYLRDNRASSPANSKLESSEYKPSENTSYYFINTEVMSLVNGTAPSKLGLWNISEIRYGENLSSHAQRQPSLQPDAFYLSAKYCLAETPKRSCRK